MTDYALGAHPSPPDPRDWPLQLAPLTVPLPRRFVCNGMGPVLDQGDKPQCVAYASSGSQTWRAKRDAEGVVDFDESWLYVRCKAIDGIPGDGTDGRSAMRVLKGSGMKALNRPEPPEHFKVAAYYAVPLDLDEPQDGPRPVRPARRGRALVQLVVPPREGHPPARRRRGRRWTCRPDLRLGRRRRGGLAARPQLVGRLRRAARTATSTRRYARYLPSLVGGVEGDRRDHPPGGSAVSDAYFDLRVGSDPHMGRHEHAYPPSSETFATPLTITPPDALPVEQAPAASPTESDVKEALAKVPPKWSATFWRFTKTLLAGMAAAFGVAWASTGGTIEGVARDPQRSCRPGHGRRHGRPEGTVLEGSRMSNVTDTQKFVVSTIGAIVCIVLSVLAYVTPPVLALGDPLRVILLVAGLGALGVQVATGYQASRVSTAAKVDK